MMKKLFVLLASPLIAGVGTVNLTITETGGAARTNFPVRVGIPISQAADVINVNSLRITDPGDTVIVSDLEVLSRWGGAPTDGTKPIKVLLANFQASVSASGTATYKLVDSAASEPAPPTLTVTDNTDHWLIDTGSCKFEVDQTGGFRFLRQVDVGVSTIITQDVADLYVVEGGTTYSASNGTISLAERERSGDMFEQVHIKGNLHDGVSTSALQYDARLYFHAGSCAVRSQVTIVFDQDMYLFDPSDLGISLPLNLGANYTFDSQGTQVAMTDSDNVYLLQEDSDAWYVRKNAAQQATGAQSDGAASLFDSSLGVAVWKRWAWQEYPWEVEADADTLNLHFWPVHADFVSLVAAKETEATGSSAINNIFPYQQSNLMSFRGRSESGGLFVASDENAYGVAKTWELVLEFHGATPKDPEVLADEWDNRLIPWNGAYFTGTGVFGDIGEDVTGLGSTDIIQNAEDRLGDFFSTIDSTIASWHLYGLLVYGDHCYTNAAGSAERFWLSTRKDWNAARPLHYIRTGGWAHLDRAEAESRHIADIEVNHVTGSFTDGNGQAVDKVVGGLIETHNNGNGAHWTNCSWGQPSCSPINGEPQVDDPSFGFLFLYYLTGDDRLYDVLFERADKLDGGFGTPNGPRQVSNLATLIIAYELTWTASYLADADVIVAEALLDHDSGGFEVPVFGFLSGGTTSPGWSVFMTAWAERALTWYHHVTGDSDVLALLKRMGKAGVAATHGSDAHGTEQWEYSGSHALAYCYQQSGCSAVEAIPALRRELAMWVMSKRLYTVGSGSPTNTFAQNSAFYSTCVPYAIKTLQDYGDYEAIAGESNPAQQVSLTASTATTFYVNEATDGTITLRYSVATGGVDPTFGAWQEAGTVNFTVLDPDSIEIYNTNFSSADIGNTVAEQYAGGVDNRYVEIVLAGDSKTGVYTVEITSNTANHMVYPVYCSTGKQVVYAPRTGPTGLGRGVWWFQGPDGTDSVQIGWSSVVGAVGPHWQAYPGTNVSQTLNVTDIGGIWGWVTYGSQLGNVHLKNFYPYVKDTKPLFSVTPEQYFDVASVSVDTTAIGAPVVTINNTGGNQSPPGEEPPAGPSTTMQGSFTFGGTIQ